MSPKGATYQLDPLIGTFFGFLHCKNHVIKMEW